jgi:hypothetical protein
MPKKLHALLALTVSLATAFGCKREAPAVVTPEPAPAAPTAQPAPSPPTPAPGSQPNEAQVPSGPRAEHGESDFALVAELTAGAPASLSVELRGAGGYHVNEQYPIAIDLDVRNGSAQKTNLRRADAAEYTQERARFVVPVTAQGPGTTVRGRVRFAVCSAENCVPKSQNFAVALP